jgi:hypothetical protein
MGAVGAQIETLPIILVAPLLLGKKERTVHGKIG